MNEEIASSVGKAVANAYAKAFTYDPFHPNVECPLTLRSYVWYAALAFALLALVSAFFTRDYNHFMTDNVARKLQGSARVKTKDAEGSEPSNNEKAGSDTGVVQHEHTI